MKNIHISSDIIPPGEFKAGISTCWKKVQTSSRPLIISQNGRPTRILVSPAEYDALAYRKQFRESVERGLAAAESGEVYSTVEVKKMRAKKKTFEKI
jgi:prevent-host-death family protein